LDAGSIPAASTTFHFGFWIEETRPQQAGFLNSRSEISGDYAACTILLDPKLGSCLLL
jgi:hypothetical protein